MKNRISHIFFIIIFILSSLLILSTKISADEIDIVAKTITINDKEKKIFGEGEVVATSKDGLIINTDRISYDKINNILEAENNVKIIDEINNSKIIADKIIYYRDKEIIQTFGNTNILFKDNYEIQTNDIVFDRSKKTFLSKKDTITTDKYNNKLSVNNFIYSIQNYTLRSQGKVKLIDNLNNSYFFKDILADTKNDKFAGKDIKIIFNKEAFGSNKNDPRLFANSAIINKNSTKIENGVFTTCKKRGEKCPPWQFSAKEIIHNKKNKTINYKSALLKVYDVPIMYFPKFFHPDPTVKRQSGFLMPSLTSSSTLGTGINLPYYFAIAKNKDLTFKPKIYFNENPVFQSEYRHITKNTNTIIDTSFNQGYKNKSATKTPGSRNHFFLSSEIDLGLEKYESSNLNLKLETTSNDTYLRVHNIDSDLITSNNLLNSYAELSFLNNNSSLFLNFNMYENLSDSSNRYEFLAPNYRYSNLLHYSEKFGTFDLKSNGYYKNYNTNSKEVVMVNDIDWKSNDKISQNGVIYNFLGKLKNTNYQAEKSNKLKNEETNFEISPVIALKSSYPLKKENDLINKILSPAIMLRYAPGHMKDYKTDQLRLTTNNLFSLNKIDGTSLEKGASFILGTDYKITDKKENLDKLDVTIGQIYNLKENRDMPIQSSLDQKTSELVGNIKYNFSHNNSLNYNFSLDHNFNELNYNEIQGSFKVNNFVTNFDYVEENKTIGDSNFLNTSIKYLVDDANSLNFKTRKNFKTDATEFYNLNYQYENDCLRAGIEFNRSYYSDRDIEPNDTLLFKLTIIPFGQINTPSLIDF